MIIKALIAILTAAIALHVSVARADECITVDSFASAFAKEGVELRGSKAAATEKMAKVFNQNRAASGAPAQGISIFLLGFVESPTDGIVAVVAIADKRGCIVEKSVATIALRNLMIFMEKSGVDISDFIPLDGA